MWHLDSIDALFVMLRIFGLLALKHVINVVPIVEFAPLLANAMEVVLLVLQDTF